MHRAGTKQKLLAPGQGPQAVQRCLSAQRDLRARQATGAQGIGQWLRIGRTFQRHHGNELQRLQSIDHVLIP